MGYIGKVLQNNVKDFNYYKIRLLFYLKRLKKSANLTFADFLIGILLISKLLVFFVLSLKLFDKLVLNIGWNKFVA